MIDPSLCPKCHLHYIRIFLFNKRAIVSHMLLESTSRQFVRARKLGSWLVRTVDIKEHEN